MAVVLPQFLVVERFERLDGRDVRRQRRGGFEQVAEPFAAGREPAVEGVGRGGQQRERQQAPKDVAADLAEPERQGALSLQVVDRLRRGVDLERRHLEIDRVAARKRVEDVLVGIEHPRRAEVVTALVEGREAVALAQLQAAAVAFERIDRQALDHLDLAVPVLELRELHHLHEVLLHVDHQIEAVADQNAVGFGVRRDRRRVLRRGRHAGQQEERC